MKKIINFLAVLLICFSTIKAQTYLPLFTPDSTEWNVHIVAFGLGDGWYTVTTSVAVSNNDTILNCEQYNECFLQNDSFYVSQSTDFSKVWLYNDSVGKKLLVYDISLQETDSFKFYTFQNSTLDSMFIHIDSIYVENGRKVIEFDRDLNYNPFNANDEFPDWKFKFIEGVGPNNFFYYPFLFQNYPINVICKTTLGQLEYEIEDEYYTYENCKVRTKIKEIQEVYFKIKVLGRNIIIENKQNISVSRLLVVDLLGRKLVEKMGFETDFQTINLETNGVLFILIETETGLYSQKIYIK